MSIVEEQKKRTQEALERRFVVAKAELQRQEESQNKNKKRQLLDGKNLQPCFSSASTAAKSGHNKIDASSTLKPFSNTLFKRDQAKSQDMEANSPAYNQLSHTVHESLLTTSPKISNRKGSMVDRILHELLENGDSAQKYMQGSRRMKIDNWILLDNYVHGRGAGAGIKALPTHSKRSKKHMSMKQLKKCGSLELPCEVRRFDTFLPMHKKWRDYITQLLKTVGRNQLAQCLLTADLCGAIIQVAQCKITTFTGVSGIMIRETAETFGIVTADDKFRVVPKNASVFLFQADCWKITLHGDKLASRNVNL